MLDEMYIKAYLSESNQKYWASTIANYRQVLADTIAPIPGNLTKGQDPWDNNVFMDAAVSMLSRMSAEPQANRS